jgi:hypothetical protein
MSPETSTSFSGQALLERALAFAHAALDRPTVENLELARRCAADVLTLLQRRTLTLGEAQRTVILATQLRAVLNAVDESRSGDTL